MATAKRANVTSYGSPMTFHQAVTNLKNDNTATAFRDSWNSFPTSIDNSTFRESFIRLNSMSGTGKHFLSNDSRDLDAEDFLATDWRLQWELPPAPVPPKAEATQQEAKDGGGSGGSGRTFAEVIARMTANPHIRARRKAWHATHDRFKKYLHVAKGACKRPAIAIEDDAGFHIPDAELFLTLDDMAAADWYVWDPTPKPQPLSLEDAVRMLRKQCKGTILRTGTASVMGRLKLEDVNAKDWIFRSDASDASNV